MIYWIKSDLLPTMQLHLKCKANIFLSRVIPVGCHQRCQLVRRKRTSAFRAGHPIAKEDPEGGQEGGGVRTAGAALDRT